MCRSLGVCVYIYIALLNRQDLGFRLVECLGLLDILVCWIYGNAVYVCCCGYNKLFGI